MSLIKVDAENYLRVALGDMPVRYRGPFGPIEGVQGARRTELLIPAGPAMVEWGREHNRDVFYFRRRGREIRRALRAGLGFSVAGRTGTVTQPHMGKTRWGRVVIVEAGGRTWRWRRRGVLMPRHQFERADGHSVVEDRFFIVRRSRRGLHVDEAADELDVGTGVLLWASGLPAGARGSRCSICSPSSERRPFRARL